MDECYDCGATPTVATDDAIGERYCADCAVVAESHGDLLTYDC